MAQELRIRERDERVKLRSPWAAALLPFVTLGIYHLVWWYRINRELRDFGRARGFDLGQSPTSSLLALFPGAIIVVPALVSYWRGTRRVQGAARLAGREPLNGWIALILYVLISPAFYAYLQSALNGVWRVEAEPLPGGPPLPPPSDEMPARLDADVASERRAAAQPPEPAPEPGPAPEPEPRRPEPEPAPEPEPRPVEPEPRRPESEPRPVEPEPGRPEPGPKPPEQAP